MKTINKNDLHRNLDRIVDNVIREDESVIIDCDHGKAGNSGELRMENGKCGARMFVG
jgi:hypothetical protein